MTNCDKYDIFLKAEPKTNNEIVTETNTQIQPKSEEYQTIYFYSQSFVMSKMETDKILKSKL